MAIAVPYKGPESKPGKHEERPQPEDPRRGFFVNTPPPGFVHNPDYPGEGWSEPFIPAPSEK